MRAALLLTLAFLLLAFSAAPVGTINTASLQSSPLKWTIMVYMADDYPPELPWQGNINEMAAADQAPGTNVIALVDPLGSGNSQLVKVEHGGQIPYDDSGAVIPPSHEVDMGSPDTLSSFIRFSVTAFPADRYVLILWGHGATPAWWGMCPDSTPLDILTLPEVGAALSNATAFIGRPLDLVGIDACAEGSMEMLYELRGCTGYFLASEKNIPFQGLPYTAILNDLASNPDMSTDRFGSDIVRDYIDWSRYNSTYSATLALFNMSRLDGVLDGLESLSSWGIYYDSIFHGALRNAFATAEYYETQWSADLGDLLSQLIRSPIPLEVQKTAVDTALKYRDMIASFASFNNPYLDDGIHANRSSGAVIYAATADPLYPALGISGTNWYEFGRLERRIAQTNASAPGPSVAYGDATGDGLADEVTVTWPSSYGSYRFWDFLEEPGGLFLLKEGSGTGPGFTIGSSQPGYHTLSVSAGDSSSNPALTHSTIKVTLFGKLALKIHVTRDGVGKQVGYDLRIMTANSTMMQPENDGNATFELVVPSQAEVGDVITVQVLDNRTGSLLSERLVILRYEQTTVMVDVPRPANANLFNAGLWFIALLPGSLILLFALFVHLENKRKARAR